MWICMFQIYNIQHTYLYVEWILTSLMVATAFSLTLVFKCVLELNTPSYRNVLSFFPSSRCFSKSRRIWMFPCLLELWQAPLLSLISLSMRVDVRLTVIKTLSNASWSKGSIDGHILIGKDYYDYDDSLFWWLQLTWCKISLSNALSWDCYSYLQHLYSPFILIDMIRISLTFYYLSGT